MIIQRVHLVKSIKPSIHTGFAGNRDLSNKNIERSPHPRFPLKEGSKGNLGSLSPHKEPKNHIN